MTAEPLVVMGGCPTGGDTVPPTPATLTARPDHKAVSLSWTPASDASGISAYRVHRATGATGAFALRTTLSGSATGHVDTGLVNGTLYRYSVTAVDGAGNLGTSTIVSATPRDVTAPAAPALTGSGHDRSATLSWTAPTDVSGIRAFQLWRALPGSSSVLRTTTSGRPAVSTPAWRTAPRTGTWSGPWTGPATSPRPRRLWGVVPVDDRAPGLVTPTVMRGDGQLTLTWRAAADSSGVRVRSPCRARSARRRSRCSRRSAGAR